MLAACRGEPTDRPPVWLMRQAGRYLPEYREVRSRMAFLELCADADAAADVSLQPYRRFGMDGIVVFSDILLPLAGLGLGVDFAPGPVVRNPIRGAADLDRLAGSPAEYMRPTCAAIRKIADATEGSVAVLGFAGAPWTLAAYALEEKLSRDTVAITALSYAEPALLDRLLDRMAEITAETLALQIEAGANAIQIFDTWAGMLAAPRFRRFAGRALERVIDLLPEERPPLILFARGASHLAEELVGLGPDVVSLDWRVDLGSFAERFGQQVSLQGNLDPAALMQAPDEVAREVRALVAAGRKARGHVVNLGHGLQPHTPVESVGAFVDAVKASG